MRDRVDITTGEESIVNIKRAWAKERDCDKSVAQIECVPRKVYAMVQLNTPCEVDITEKSMFLCVEALLR